MTDLRETPKSADAFEQYYALGPGRSLAKLATKGGLQLAQLKEWSAKYNWQERVAERQREEVEAARAAARKEAAALARRRLRNAQLLQEVGVTILAKADIAALNSGAARDLIGQARAVIAEGVKIERDEAATPTDEDLAAHADLDTLRRQIIARLLGSVSEASARDLMAMLRYVDDARVATPRAGAVPAAEPLPDWGDETDDAV